LGNVQACSVWVASDQMEAAMHKAFGTITSAFAILSATLLACGSAEAGASASAPSKYSYANQVASANQARTHRHGHSAITEYSSSTRIPSQKH
jgi:hypothetical protein